MNCSGVGLSRRPFRSRLVSEHRETLRSEFERAAHLFAERTRGRFNDLDVVRFARAQPGSTVVEVGAGTGNFLALFAGVAGRLMAVDVTFGMLVEARRHPGVELVQADGARLPFPPGSIDLIACAQAFHHIFEPVPILKEMFRVIGTAGAVLVVDQVAPESFEKAAVMNQLDVLRDPSHAVSRPPSAFRIMVRSAGLEIADEKIVASSSRLSNWMWPGEFPPERIERVREFIERHGDKTGMDFAPDGDDFTFTRRRIMILARRPPPSSSRVQEDGL
jgi:SAM-dependent methyltransferase